MTFACYNYRTENATANSLQARLDASARLSFVHAIDDLRWYKAVDEQGFQRIARGADYLVSCISSLDNLDSWQDILGDRFPGLREWQIVNTSFLRQAPPTELVPVWFNVMRDQETERWLHTPHGELDNKTPLEQLEEAAWPGEGFRNAGTFCIAAGRRQ